MLLAYAIGSGIPVLGIAYGGQYGTARVRSLARHVHRLQQGFGVVWLSDFYSNANVGL